MLASPQERVLLLLLQLEIRLTRLLALRRWRGAFVSRVSISRSPGIEIEAFSIVNVFDILRVVGFVVIIIISVIGRDFLPFQTRPFGLRRE